MRAAGEWGRHFNAEIVTISLLAAHSTDFKGQRADVKQGQVVQNNKIKSFSDGLVTAGGTDI